MLNIDIALIAYLFACFACLFIRLLCLITYCLQFSILCFQVPCVWWWICYLYSNHEMHQSYCCEFVLKHSTLIHFPSWLGSAIYLEVSSMKAIAQICPCKIYVIALGPIKREKIFWHFFSKKNPIIRPIFGRILLKTGFAHLEIHFQRTNQYFFIL